MCVYMLFSRVFTCCSHVYLHFTQLVSPVDVILKATGDAPIMKKKKWAIVSSRTVAWVATFVKKFIKLQDTDSLVSCDSVVSCGVIRW